MWRVRSRHIRNCVNTPVTAIRWGHIFVATGCAGSELQGGGRRYSFQAQVGHSNCIQATTDQRRTDVACPHSSDGAAGLSRLSRH